MRRSSLPVLVLAMLLLTACGSGSVGSTGPAPSGTDPSGAADASPSAAPSPSPVDVGALTIDQFAEALPTDDELPPGTSDIERCVSTDTQASMCDVGDEWETAALSATLPGDDEGLFFGAGLNLTVTQGDVDLDAARGAAQERDGEFAVEGEVRDDGGLVPDQRGDGELGDATIGGRPGFVQTDTRQYSPPGESDWSDPQATVSLVVVTDGTMVTCNARGAVDDSPTDMAELCRGLAEDFVARAGSLAGDGASS